MTFDDKFKQELWERLNVLLRTARNETLEKEMEIEEEFVNWILKRVRLRRARVWREKRKAAAKQHEATL